MVTDCSWLCLDNLGDLIVAIRHFGQQSLDLGMSDPGGEVAGVLGAITPMLGRSRRYLHGPRI